MTNSDIRKLAQRAIRSAIRHHDEGRKDQCGRALLFAQSMLAEETTDDYAVAQLDRRVRDDQAERLEQRVEERL